MRLLGFARSDRTSVLTREDADTGTPRRRTVWGHREKTVNYTLRRETLQQKLLSEKTNPANTLILDFWPPDSRDNKFLMFKLQGQCFFVPVALEGSYTQQ